MNVKVFNLVSRTNETRYIKWRETCKCKCRLDASACNNKQRLNEDKCRCEYKELIDKGMCNKRFNWNPSNSECECDKSCDVGECLHYKNCKCRQSLLDKLVEECSENIDKKELHSMKLHSNQMIYNSTPNDYEQIRSSCVYIVFLVIFFIISISISITIIYFHWYLKNKHIEINGKYQAH